LKLLQMFGLNKLPNFVFIKFSTAQVDFAEFQCGENASQN